jgi:hypothetical protein
VSGIDGGRAPTLPAIASALSLVTRALHVAVRGASLYVIAPKSWMPSGFWMTV